MTPETERRILQWAFDVGELIADNVRGGEQLVEIIEDAIRDAELEVLEWAEKITRSSVCENCYESCCGGKQGELCSCHNRTSKKIRFEIERRKEQKP